MLDCDRLGLPDRPFAIIIAHLLGVLPSSLFTVEIASHLKNAIIMHAPILLLAMGDRYATERVVVGPLLQVACAIAVALGVITTHQFRGKMLDKLSKSWKGDTDNHEICFYVAARRVSTILTDV